MDLIDLRSDTVTWPTPEMREAMATAPVGDDVYGEDPTVNALEALAAEMLSKEAGLFVASGTMGNLAALFAHCQRGDEAIVGDSSHIFIAEAGSPAAFGGVQCRPLAVQPDGTLRIEDICAAIRPENDHYPVTSLISIENTQNAAGGAVLTPEYTAQVGAIAHEYGLRFHIDGARIFNAAVALDCSASDLCAPADSVMFCISKGLGAPVGSLLVGSADFIHRARRIRKGLGGGMRQAGILAAAGIVALNTMVKRLADDHARARQFAAGLATIPGITLDLDRVQTNMVNFSLAADVPYSAGEFAERLRERGLLVGARSRRSFRAVTHLWITDDQIAEAVEMVRAALS